MAKHEVFMKLGDIPIGRKDVEIPVRVDGRLIGRLKVSQGGVDWLPYRKSVRAYGLTWTQLSELMAQHGKAKH